MILSPVQFKIIERLLPPLVRMRPMNLKFSINDHGTSMNTFYAKLKDHMYSLILILDKNGNRFGAFATQEWKP
jgi:hypothetical protein